jgi:thioester reductase-like protein
MSYLLLSGATGLVGNYLVRDLLLLGANVAVVVRSNRRENAVQRIESLLAAWERRLGVTLPRPPVLEGDILAPCAGLDATAQAWVAKNCHSVMHGAASLSLEADERTGEPWRSNVEGTRNVLELCRQTGIRSFHHISTAFVCGLRDGTVREDELDVGQEFRNVYEKSKVEAEKLVHGSAFLDVRTIYRPAIIIGDSKTGYTTTSHGFYIPLKIVKALVDQFGTDNIHPPEMIDTVQMTGEEEKNLVPVDWVSRVIAHIALRPEHHGRTYHLTPRRGLPVAEGCEALLESLLEYVESRPPAPAKTAPPGMKSLIESFAEQMERYRTHWQNDPKFDATNTRQAAPDLECPRVDKEMLVRTAPMFNVAEHLSTRLPSRLSEDTTATTAHRIALQVNGPGGGQWTLVVDDQETVSMELGIGDRCEGLLYMNSTTLRRCALGELSVDDAVAGGQIVIESDGPQRELFTKILQSMVGESVAMPST